MRYLKTYRWIVLIGVIAFTSCKADVVSDDTVARNLVAGIWNGESFASTSWFCVKQADDVFLLTGSVGPGNTVLASFNGNDEQEYPEAENGALVLLTEYLNDLISGDSLNIDTMAIEQAFSDSAELIPDGSSFMFVIGDDGLFFSSQSSIELHVFDASINRLYGKLNGEFVNAVDGPVYLSATFDDVFYLDCASLSTCIP